MVPIGKIEISLQYRIICRTFSLFRHEIIAKKSFKTAVNGSEEFTKIINSVAKLYGKQRYKNRLHLKAFEEERGEKHINFIQIFPVSCNISIISLVFHNSKFMVKTCIGTLVTYNFGSNT